MTRMSVFNSPLLLGFDHFERMLDRASKASAEGYPPYNIEQVGDNKLRITLAVAGFSMDDLAVSVDAGNVELRLPEGVGLIGSAEVSVGRVAGPGRESSGLGNPALMFNTPGPRGTVDLDARVDIGNIEISRG